MKAREKIKQTRRRGLKLEKWQKMIEKNKREEGIYKKKRKKGRETGKAEHKESRKNNNQEADADKIEMMEGDKRL